MNSILAVSQQKSYYKKLIHLFYMLALCILVTEYNTNYNDTWNLSMVPHVISHNRILDCNYKPTQQLSNLLDLLKIAHDGTLQSIVNATQKTWLRTAGKERWQVDELYPEMKEQLKPYFNALDLYEEITPSKAHYDYIVLLGSTCPSFRDKMAHMIFLWNKGIRFNQIIMLGSERKLDPIIESNEVLFDTNNIYLPFSNTWKHTGKPVTTEYDMLKMVYDQANLPDDLKKIPVIAINAPNTIKPDGTVKRATTDDTIFQWLKEKPAPGSCLFISHQPFIWYQDCAVRTFMPNAFTIETVCPKSTRQTNIEILDALARFLYQANMMHKVIQR